MNKPMGFDMEDTDLTCVTQIDIECDNNGFFLKICLSYRGRKECFSKQENPNEFTRLLVHFAKNFKS